ncbi:serine hydrolase domain-containing protein [Hyphomonas sp.]|uniref:serine hydrolase domain-containing protein n=1 Tax=Hyphomonas sp. TaxID=87 RepID=UPI00391D9645
MPHLRLILSALLLAACSAPVSAPRMSQPAAPATATNTLPAEGFYVLPEIAGWNTAALEDYFAYVEAQNSTGIVIIDRERIIAERVWPAPVGDAMFALFVHGRAADGALVEDVASLQKSIIALLAGIAEDKGLLNADYPASHYLGAGWSKAAPEQEAAITVRHLMEMNSGLKEDLTSEAAPGEKFFYNTPAYAKLQSVLEAASGAPLAAITEAWLTRPLGLAETGWRPRPAAFGNVGNPMALVSTPRELSRFGQMVLDNGRAPDGTRVISAEALAALFAPTETNPAYGRLWWLNSGDWSLAAGGVRREGAFIPAAPADTITGLGFLGRQVFIVPSKGLVIVRTGASPPDTEFLQKSWELLAKAMPE